MNKTFWLKQLRIGYYVFWAMCGLYFLVLTAKEVFTASNESNRATYARYPAITPAQMEAEFTEIGKVAHGPNFSDPVLYFRILGRLDDLEKSCRRMEAQGDNNVVDYRWGVVRSRNLTDALVMRLNLSSGREAFDQESAKYLKMHPVTIPEAPCDRSKVLTLLLHGYLVFVLLTFGHNCRVLKANGCSIQYEMFRDKPEFWYYPWIFPVGLFRYPYDVYPSYQVIRACRFLLRIASLVMSTVLTAWAQVGSVVKKIQDDSGGDGQTSGDCYRIDVSTRTRTQYFGNYVADIFFSGEVQQSSLTLSFPGFKDQLLKGLSFNLWNSSAINSRPWGSGYGSEVDLSANWAGKIRGLNMSFGLTYIDVYPLVVLPRGDVVEGTASIGKTLHVNDGLTLEPYLFNALAAPTRGKTPDGGLVTHAGANVAWQPRGWLTVKVNPHVVHNTNGLFAEKAGYLFGGMFDIGVKASKHVTVHPVELQTGLPISVHDGRKNRLVFGFGLDYSFGF